MGNENYFNVYIDESGDEGFTVKDNKWASSKWFVLGALIVRNDNDHSFSTCLNEIKNTLGIAPDKVLHFKKLSHEKRKYVLKVITDKKMFFCTYVAVNKKELDKDTPLKQKGVLYNYSCRYLLERVTWLVGDLGGKANLIFEHRRNTSYEDLEKYIRDVMKFPGNQIRKNVIKSFKAINKHQSKNLQLADSIVGSLYQALELNAWGLYESSYIESLKPFIYQKNNNYYSYGLKFFPDAFNSKKLINTYQWIKNFLK